MEELIECKEQYLGINFDYNKNIKKYIGEINLKNISSSKNIIVKLYINSFKKFTVDNSIIILKKNESKKIRIFREQINIDDKEKNKFLLISFPCEKEIINVNEARNEFVSLNYKLYGKKILLIDNYNLINNLEENEKDIGTHSEKDFIIRKEIKNEIIKEDEIKEEIIKEMVEENSIFINNLNKKKNIINKLFKLHSKYFYYFLMSSIVFAVVLNKIK